LLKIVTTHEEIKSAKTKNQKRFSAACKAAGVRLARGTDFFSTLFNPASSSREAVYRSALSGVEGPEQSPKGRSD
jgi:predicted amidohydrolase YtcJ